LCEAITLCNLGVDLVRKVKASSLEREFDAIMFLDGESIDDFATRIGRIPNQLVVLGFEYKEEEIVRKFLQALMSKFDQIAASIKTLLNLEIVMVDELVGLLEPSKERINYNGGGACWPNCWPLQAMVCAPAAVHLCRSTATIIIYPQ
jgi:hypothetical protein